MLIFLCGVQVALRILYHICTCEACLQVPFCKSSFVLRELLCCESWRWPGSCGWAATSWPTSLGGVFSILLVVCWGAVYLKDKERLESENIDSIVACGDKI